MKIAKFKKEKEDKGRIAYLNEKIERRKAAKQRNKAKCDDDEDMLEQLELGDEEAEARECYLLQLSLYMRNGLDEIHLLNQELQMLQHMEKLRQQEPSRQQSAESVEAAKAKVLSGSIWADPERRANILSMPGVGSRPDPLGESHGIEVTRTGNAPDGSLLMTKEVVKAGVFKDSIAPPTMTIEEFGDLEKVSFFLSFFLSPLYTFFCNIQH